VTSPCVIEGRTVFGTVDEERDEKVRSLCSPFASSQCRFIETLAGFERRPDELTAVLAYSQSLDFSRSPLGSSYLSHPLRLATYLIRIRPSIDADLLRIALLHNVPEIGGADCSEIRSQFGPVVATGIETLLVDRSVPFESIKSDYYAHIFAAGAELTLVKLLDKMDNLFTLCLNPDSAVRTRYLAEIHEMLVPFAVDLHADLGRYLRDLLDDAARAGFSPTLADQVSRYRATQDSRRIGR
jgi:(p)ppGpp synthase/HD superfamily hydrolase